MKTDISTVPLRDRLIAEGINELKEVGFEQFSLRHVAERCHVSCAAPYRHFADKTELIVAILTYINGQWTECVTQVVAKPFASTRDKLVAVSMAYITFLLENPKFRSIIMQSGSADLSDIQRPIASLSQISRELVDRYCAEVEMPPEVRFRKLFVIRSLIYGAALMIDNGELPTAQATMEMVRQTMEREFDLP